VISVILVTRDRRELLARTLDALAAQDWPAASREVVLVDNGSTDGTPAFVRDRLAEGGWPGVRLFEERRSGKSFAVNQAVSVALGDLLVFTDDDVIPVQGWLTAFHRAMDETRADFAVGRILPIWGAPPPAWLPPSLLGVVSVPDNGTRRLEIRKGLNDGVMPIGANMALRRDVVERVGTWRTDLGKLHATLRTGEDHEFYLRMLAAGLRGVYEPAARVGHLVPASRLDPHYFRRWLFDNGQVTAHLEASYPSTPHYVLGVPRYLWRAAAANVGRWLRARVAGGPQARFETSGQLLWFAGYARGSWFGRAPSQADPSAARGAAMRPVPGASRGRS
jgi:glucosyl-dolichyl phosphate glucuronosyltransferase